MEHLVLMAITDSRVTVYLVSPEFCAVATLTSVHRIRVRMKELAWMTSACLLVLVTTQVSKEFFVKSISTNVSPILVSTETVRT